MSQLDSCSALLRGWPSSDRQASEREDNDDDGAGGTAIGSRIGVEVGVEPEGASQPGFASPCPVFCSCKRAAWLLCEAPIPAVLLLLSLFFTWSNSLLNSNKPRTPMRELHEG